MSTRHKGIIAYGTEDDRNKLALLAKARRQSASVYLINLIREKYQEFAGDADPKSINLPD